MPKGGSAHGVLEDTLLKRHGPEPMKIQKKRNLFDEIRSGIADMQAHRERKVNSAGQWYFAISACYHPSQPWCISSVIVGLARSSEYDSNLTVAAEAVRAW